MKLIDKLDRDALASEAFTLALIRLGDVFSEVKFALDTLEANHLARPDDIAEQRRIVREAGDNFDKAIRKARNIKRHI